LTHTVVIGGGGFLGLPLLHCLVASGRKVTVLGRRAHPQADLAEGCTYVPGDYSNRSILKEVLAPGCEVIDLAYSTVPKTSFQDPVFDLLSNLPASVGLLQEAAACGVARVLFVSSGGTVYGPALRLPIDENHPTEPISPYGITKLTIEKYARMFSINTGLHVVIARPANAYGETQRHGTGQGFIAAAVHAALNGLPVQVFGGEGTIRDYVHVEDVALGLLAVLEHGVNGQCYNIGTAVGSSNRKVIELIEQHASAFDCRVNVDNGPARSFDVMLNVLDSSKLSQASGWSPRISLSEGIQRVWRCAVAQRPS
jgi:UDP-glucose 4-epimerase